MMKNLLLVGLGGGVGSIARYLCTRILTTRDFPLATFIVNVTGCLIIGLLFGLFMRQSISESKYLLLLTGFCGGFTTFSAFTLEGNELLKNDKIGLFLLYTGASVILGLGATWLGIRLTR